VVFLVTVTTVAAFERQRIPDWQQALNLYLEQTRLSALKLGVQEPLKSTLPWNFRAEMGNPNLELRKWPWDFGRLPYPPDRLYCVIVGPTPSAAKQADKQGVQPPRQLLYIAHHTDAMWRVGWVVHQGPTLPFDAAASSDLAAIGCNF
jgi:hypothetical protein